MRLQPTGLAGLLVVGAAFLAAAPEAGAIDARAFALHVTQGTQRNAPTGVSMPLVSHRRTAVRVTILGDTGPPRE